MENESISILAIIISILALIVSVITALVNLNRNKILKKGQKGAYDMEFGRVTVSLADYVMKNINIILKSKSDLKNIIDKEFSNPKLNELVQKLNVINQELDNELIKNNKIGEFIENMNERVSYNDLIKRKIQVKEINNKVSLFSKEIESLTSLIDLK